MELAHALHDPRSLLRHEPHDRVDGERGAVREVRRRRRTTTNAAQLTACAKVEQGVLGSGGAAGCGEVSPADAVHGWDGGFGEMGGRVVGE